MKQFKTFITLCCLSLLLNACSNNKSLGFDKPEDLFKESLIALKSKDKAVITGFMVKLFPDNGTLKYMKKHKCSYRGIPEGTELYPNAIDSAIVVYSQKFYNYALYLDRSGSLEDLRFIGFEREFSPDPLSSSCKSILFESPHGIFVSEKKKDTIKYELGELLFVNGKWKSFSDF